MRTASAKTARSFYLDIVRIFACAWVAMFHWQGNGGFFPKLDARPQLDLPDWQVAIGQSGFLGVDIFFVLSGIVISTSISNKTWAKFLAARFIRLYPTYLIATILTAIIVPMAVNAARSTVVENTASFIWLQYVFKTRYLLGASWSLEFELLFYISVSLMLLLSGVWARRPGWFNFHFAGWLVVFSTLLYFLTQTRLCSQGCGPIETIFHTLSFAGFGPYFVFGAAISTLGRRPITFATFALGLTSVLLVAAQVFVRENGTSFQVSQLPGLLMLLCSFAVMIFGQFHKPSLGNGFATRVKFLALMTYPIYLLHESMGLSLISLFVREGCPVWLAYLLAGLIVLSFSYLIVRYTDRVVTRISKLVARKIPK